MVTKKFPPQTRTIVSVYGDIFVINFPSLKFYGFKNRDNIFNVRVFALVGEEEKYILFPNITENGDICLGKELDPHWNEENSLLASIDLFWTTKFSRSFITTYYNLWKDHALKGEVLCRHKSDIFHDSNFFVPQSQAKV